MTRRLPAWSMLISVLSAVALLLFFYFDRHSELSSRIQAYGSTGTVGALVIMALVCMTPFPSEGLLVVDMKVYGVFWGSVLGWTGYMLSALLIFVIARLGSRVLVRWVPKQRIEWVDERVRRGGAGGIIIARLLPLPAYLVNYLLGLIPAVSMWNYLWTCAVTILPYYAATGLLYVGVSESYVGWLVIGAAVIAAMWFITYRIRKGNSGQ